MGEWSIRRVSDRSEVVVVVATSEGAAIDQWREMSGSASEIFAKEV